MPIVRVLYRNEGRDQTWSAKGQIATLPACNLGESNRQRVYRSTGFESTQWVKVDLGSAKSIEMLALISGNHTTNAVITIEAASCNGLLAMGGGLSTGASFSTSLTPWAAPRSNINLKLLSAAQSYQWWRLVISDTGNTATGLQFGAVVLGPVFQFDVGPAQEVEYGIVDPSVVGWAPSGTPKTYELNPYAVVRLPFRLMAQSKVYDGFQDLLREAGAKRDAVLSLFSSEPSCSDIARITNFYGRFTQLSPARYQPVNRWDWEGEFRESL